MKSEWLRGFAAVMMGLIVGFVLSFGVELINSRIYPLPEGIDRRDEAMVRAALARLPAPALVGKLLGWFLAALSGGWVATRIARGDHRPAWVLCVLLVVAAIGNMRAITHPLWFWVAALALYPVGIMLGARLGTPALKPAG